MTTPRDARALRAHLAPIALAMILAALTACSSSDGTTSADASGLDATTHEDAIVVTDAAPASDAALDASAPRDAEVITDAAPTNLDAEPINADAEPANLDATTAPDATAVDAGGAPDAGFANACKNVGGICVGTASACTMGSGTVLAAGAPGCIFSDGPGVCCEPPPAAAEGPTCQQHGGVCAPIAGCNFVDGAFAPPSCGFPGFVCCVPESQCGPEIDVCCEPGGQTTYRTSCDYGQWTCIIPGTQRMPPANCP